MTKKEYTNEEINKGDSAGESVNTEKTIPTHTNQNPVTFKEVMAFIKKELKRNLVLVIALIILGLVALAYNYRSLVVVATVNGQPIYRWQIISLLEKQMGERALNMLITERLIENEAKAKKIDASASEIDTRLQEFKDSANQQGITFSDWLESNGMNEKDFRNQLKSLILVEKMLQDKLNVTDEEVKSFIETYKDSGLTDDEEGRSIAREQLKQQKMAAEYTTFIEELKKAQSVNILMKY